MTARQEIEQLLAGDLAAAGDDLDELRRLETNLEPMKAHDMVGAAVREISAKILYLALEEE